MMTFGCVQPSQPSKAKPGSQSHGDKRGDDATAIEHPHGREIKEIQKITRPGQRDEQRRAKMDSSGMTKKGRERAEHRAANSNASFHPGIARRFFQKNERADKWNEHRRADFESEFLATMRWPHSCSMIKRTNPTANFQPQTMA